MGNAIRKEFGQGSQKKSALGLGGGTPRAKKMVKVVPVHNGERVRIFFADVVYGWSPQKEGKGKCWLQEGLRVLVSEHLKMR